MASTSLRSKVIQLYKNLQFLGKEYPGENGPQKFRKQCHDEFMKNSKETDPKKIKALLAKGRYIQKEVEALYSLKKYRTMKNRYYKNNEG